MIRFSPNIELVASIFAILLSTTASFLVRQNQIEQELLLHIWKVTSLVIISLGFRFSLELITIKGKISYLRIFSPILFWILSVIIPVYILVLITVVGLIGFLKRNKTSPGITGWAQINGYRGSKPSDHQMRMRMEHDLWYMNNWNIWLDLYIIFRTLFIIFNKPNK